MRNLVNTIMGGLMSLGAVPAVAQSCPEGRLSLRGDWGQAHFTVDLADDSAERAQGLMYVERMPTMAGMLFVYDSPRPVAFWMKNTLIPLDMIFADQAGVVTHIHPMARPLDETPIPGGDGVQYVLEINGGLAERLGLSLGDQLHHSAITHAAWPCDAPTDEAQ